MTKHFSEAELLETYYTQPGESMPVMLHLAECGDCAARYERLERKIRNLASCEHEKPQTFWSRQRMLIMRGVEARRQRSAAGIRPWRVAAAAVLAFFLGGMFVYKTVEPNLQPLRSDTAVTARKATATASLDSSRSHAADAGDDASITHDPWQSEELQEFHGIVQWESWVDPKNDAKGSSL